MITSAPSRTEKAAELRGTPLEVARQLLTVGGRTDEVLAIIEKLIERNAELERALGERPRPANRSEHLTRSQLDLFLAQAKALVPPADIADLQQTLEDTVRAELEAKAAQEKAKANRKAPARRGARELPKHLPRIPNLIPVPDGDRACPSCQGPRTIIKSEETPVVELIPAQVVVRVDTREKLVCKACDAHVQRAPKAGKVVDGGLYGPRLVASLLVDKYDDALPLYRTHDRLLRLGLEHRAAPDQDRWLRLEQDESVSASIIDAVSGSVSAIGPIAARLTDARPSRRRASAGRGLSRRRRVEAAGARQ